MKKATLTITLLMPETPDNMENLQELKASVDNKELLESFEDSECGVTADVILTIEDVD